MGARVASIAALKRMLAKGGAKIAAAMPVRARKREPGARPAGATVVPKLWDLSAEAARNCDLVSVVVPLPPPLSRCFQNHPTKGRVKTREYRAWIDRALRDLLPQRPGRVPGDVRVHIVMRRKDAFSDGDNRLKGLGDILKRAGIIQDDRMLQRYTVEWLDAGDTVRLEIRPYFDAAGRAPMDVRCAPCGHRWTAGHYPDAMDAVVAALRGLRCPSCGADANSLFVDRPTLPPAGDAEGHDPR